MDVYNRAERQSVDGWWTGLSERELAEELTRMFGREGWEMGAER